MSRETTKQVSSELEYCFVSDNYPFYFAWKNNSKRRELHGRRLRILARGTMNSRLVEFENGQMEVISGHSIRRIKCQG